MVKIELEYVLKVSPKLLYNRLSTAAGLAEWFADDVFVKDNVYTFVWDKTEEKAEVVFKKPLVSARYKWIDADEKHEYFEFRLENHEMSNDLSLFVTDFVEQDEKDEAIILWEAQINKLKNILGL